MNFSQATDAPVVVTIDGTEVSFPVWTIGDLAELCSRLDEKRIKLAQKSARQLGVDRIDQASILQNAEFHSTTPVDIFRYFQTHCGAIECLTKSLQKAGKTHDEATAIISRLYAKELTDLALLVGRLTRPKPEKASSAAADPTQEI